MKNLLIASIFISTIFIYTSEMNSELNGAENTSSTIVENSRIQQESGNFEEILNTTQATEDTGSEISVNNANTVVLIDERELDSENVDTIVTPVSLDWSNNA